MLTDTAALLFALLAVQFSRRPPTIRHTFGWLRLTTLAAFVNAIATVVITILIVWEAIGQLHSASGRGRHDDGNCVAGLLANILSFWLLHHGSEEKNLSDASSGTACARGPAGFRLGAIIAALIIIWTGWTC
ncbi:cation diffusion facilitator family transporter [Escherichia coli]|nr:cation diffusion facilitator family transporter [Escherichia coli]